MSKRANLYLGRAGQMAVMAEFLARGLNVAIPEVDVGDDIFVVHDKEGEFWRIQVKTATVQERVYGYSAQYNVPLSQLTVPFTPELSYVFVARRNQRWESFIVINRDVLQEEHKIYNVGSLTKDNKLMLRFKFSEAKVTCSDRDFTPYLNNWDKWPVIEH